jgi:cysteinyl-tRNA synthetase
MIGDLKEQKSGRSDSKIEELTSKIVSDFQDSMNADLAVKSAFDKLYDTITELHKNRELLNAKDVKDILGGLHSADSVLQFIF